MCLLVYNKKVDYMMCENDLIGDICSVISQLVLSPENMRISNKVVLYVFKSPLSQR